MTQSKALYNRWRPLAFADVVGQEHVTRTLRNALARGQLAHAYIFCGPRGTGKTSVARVLSRAANCKQGLQPEPCNRCENCRALLDDTQLDLLIEIDGASNTGVDNVRELRENVYKRPGGGELTGRYKVYIIDEVHMLSTSAFNALLKTLEEPPPHVIFIFATTDPERVPGTVLSRCQRFDFRPIILPELIRHLQTVARAEEVEAEPAALELIARTATGSVRDALGLLEQAVAYCGRTVTLAQLHSMLGLSPLEMVVGLVDCILSRDLPRGLSLIQEAAARGVDLRQFSRQVVQFLRLLLLEQSGVVQHAAPAMGDEATEAVRLRRDGISMERLVRAIKLIAQAEPSLRVPVPQPQLPLELAFVEAILNHTALSSPPDGEGVRGEAAPPARSEGQRTVASGRTRDRRDGRAPADGWETVAAAPVVPLSPPDEAGADGDNGSQGPESVPIASPGSVAIDRVHNVWEALLARLNDRYKILVATLRDCRAIAVEPGSVVVIACRWPIHREKLDDPQNRIVVEKALTGVLESPCRIRCVLDGAGPQRGERVRRPTAVEDPVVKAALKIFNARILDEPVTESRDTLPAQQRRRSAE